MTVAPRSAIDITNVELLRVTPTPPPFLTKEFDTHPYLA
uniref:IS3/IS911 family transposase n=1 Tax=Rhizobium meliloti TaxID=382 RepID=I2E2A2_RHIML|nr:IS3/IS911 family transposase [Sinorhizobium meliloti]